MRKTHGLQGPIDDAFLESFLCVRPTGTPHHKLAHEYAVAAMDGFVKDFGRWMHGDPRIKDDSQVTPADISAHHLVLFGDPRSNKLLAQIVDRLPIRWTDKTIAVGKQTYSATDHALVMIYPNPLNPRRYVVINTGHTFHEPEFRGNNALVYPRPGRLRRPPVGSEPDSAGANRGGKPACSTTAGSWRNREDERRKGERGTLVPC